MKAVIQRVMQAEVEVEQKVVGKIPFGLLIYLGIMQGDTVNQVEELVKKIIHFRIFPDTQGKMNLSVLDVKGHALVVSQFTLAADGKKGNRPSFDLAADPEKALPLYEKFVQSLRQIGITTETGSFGQHMLVRYTNDGPVTFILEKVNAISEKKQKNSNGILLEEPS